MGKKVTLHTHFTALFKEQQRHFKAMLKEERRYEELRAATSKTALDAALKAGNEKDLAHNGLLAKMEVMQSTYVTKGALVAAVSTLTALVLASIAILGYFWPPTSPVA